MHTGRDDAGDQSHREVRTTGWVVVRFVPHPTGLRRLLTSNPLPPLLILPPLALVLTVSSALLAFLVISCCTRSRREKRAAASAASDKMKGEVRAALDFDAGDSVQPFEGGAQWQRFAAPDRGNPAGLRNRARRGDEVSRGRR